MQLYVMIHVLRVSGIFADPMAMWHVRAEIARSILLVVDFGGWYMEDAKAGEKAKVYGDGMPSNVIAHTDVSLTKDVIVPYTHLLPTLSLAESSPRDVLLYFRGARHRHRVSSLTNPRGCFAPQQLGHQGGMNAILHEISLIFSVMLDRACERETMDGSWE